MSWFRSLRRPNVAVFKLQGPLDNTKVHFLHKAIENLDWMRNVKAVACVIESNGGSGVQADLMTKILRDYCDKKAIPLYSFAETECLGGAMIPLLSADKVFAQKYAILGRLTAGTSVISSTETYGIKRWTAPTEG